MSLLGQTLGGWEVVTEELFVETTRAQVPMHEMAASTSQSSFIRNFLLPLHLRPRYKLALAAERLADVPKVEAFRQWVTERWFPRQQIPVVPCLRSQRGRGRRRALLAQDAELLGRSDESNESAEVSGDSSSSRTTTTSSSSSSNDGGRGSGGPAPQLRRRLHSNGMFGTPLNMEVVDLSRHFDPEAPSEDADRQRWIPACQPEDAESANAGMSFAYIGCYNDFGNEIRVMEDNIHNVVDTGDPALAAQECLEVCADGYAYFGLQWVDECFCGNEYSSQGEDSMSACDADGVIQNGVADLCANGDANCGNHNAVYRIILSNIAFGKPTRISTARHGR